MPGDYYKPCPELDQCRALDQYWNSQQYDKWFTGHLPLAEQGYPLAECQIGYCYSEGLGVEQNIEMALYWTRRAAEHGDRDGQFNLGCFYEEGTGTVRDMDQAVRWYREAARQGHDLALEKCKMLGITL